MKRQFTFSIRISVFAAICLGSFITLGLWQLDRETEKTSMLEVEAQRSDSAPTPLTGVIDQLALVSGQRVVLAGQFDSEVILLLDNRVLEGKVGFEVHQLFQEVSGNTVLVNRGFVPMGRTRADLPVIPVAPLGEIEIIGRVHYPVASFLAPEMKGQGFGEAAFPMIVQYPDVSLLKSLLGDAIQGYLVPFVVRAEENAPGALPRYWPTTVMSPERHRGYAVQWFAMALAVLLAWLAVSFQRVPGLPGSADEYISGDTDGK